MDGQGGENYGSGKTHKNLNGRPDILVGFPWRTQTLQTLRRKMRLQP